MAGEGAVVAKGKRPRGAKAQAGDVAKYLGDTPESVFRTYCHASGAAPTV